MKEANGQQFPGGWASAFIEDIFAPLEDGRTLHQGWSPQCEKVPRSTNDDWGVLKTTAIQAGAFLPAHNKRLPDGLNPRPQIEVKQGDILITCAGPRSRCGVAALVRSTPPKLMMSGKMYRIRVPEEFFDARFLEAFLQTSAAYDSIDRMKTGGSDSGLNLTHDRFRQLEVLVAPLNEQRRIVETYEELISDLDAGVAALERVRGKLKLYRTSVLKAAVEGSLSAEWRAQHPHDETTSALLKRILVERRRRWEDNQLARFKAKNRQPPKNWKAKYKEPVAPDTATLSPLPESWCWASPNEIAWSAGYGTSEKCRETNTGLPVLRIPNIIGGTVNLDDLKFAPPNYSEHEIDLVHFGDLLVIRTNGSRLLIGRGAVVRDEPAKRLSFASYLIRLRLIPFAAMLGWLSVVWHSSHVRRWIEARAATSAGQFNISLGILETLLVPLPPYAEQEAVVESVEDQHSIIDHLEADLDAKLKTAQTLRQAILRHAFTGKLVPQDPNDEPASELLKRIATEREARTREAAAAKRAAKKTDGVWRRRPVKQKQKDQVD